MKSQRPRKRKFTGEKKNYSIRFPEDLYKYFKQIAEESTLGISDVMGDVLDSAAIEWIENEKNKRTKNA